MAIASTACVAHVAHPGDIHVHENMSLYNPPGETFSRTTKRTYIHLLSNIHIRGDSLGPPLVILRSQDHEGSAIHPQKIHKTQCLLGELISSAKVQT
jgi:hypothetical protein